MIPKILHQLWKDRDVPARLQAFQQSWRRLNPGWEFRLWTDEELRDVVARDFPDFLPVYDGYQEPIRRADAARYLLLRRFGGLYADLDVQCLKPIDPLLAGGSLLIGLEPESHVTLGKARERGLLRILCPSLIASVPDHPFWDLVVEGLRAGRHEPDVLLPGGPPACEAGPPLLGWAWGTETRRAAAQADQAAEVANFGLSAVFAAKGYAVVATDYLGLGRSGYPFHPYLHADSEATAVIDGLRAAREAGRTLGRTLAEQVMLGGYSQGGHAAMAAQREIERSGDGEFTLAASAPMAGPYDLSGLFEASWSGRDPMAPLLLSYTLLSFQRVYGGLYERPGDVFRPAFARAVEGLFPGPLALFDLSREPPFAGAGLDELRQPAFTKTFLYDPRHPFREALQRNDLTGWTPRTPTMLCGSKRDAIVPFANALRLAEAFRERGAPVTVVDVDDRPPGELDGIEAHAGLGAYVCYAAALRMFDQARSGRGG